MSTTRRRPLTAAEKQRADRARDLWLKKKQREKVTQEDANSAIGWSSSTFGQYINGRIPINLEALLKIAKYLDVEPNQIDVGHMGEKAQRATDIAAYNALPRLPVISSVLVGSWGDAANPFEPGDADDWEIVTGLSRHAFVLRVEGDSMTSQRGGMSIPNGAKVAVEPNAQPENGSIVVAKLGGMEAVTIKKLVVEPPYNFLMPLNELYDRISVTEDCRIVGVVKKVIQDLR